MIRLSNGQLLLVSSASGALGFDGNDAGHGWAKLWKKPWRWLGYIDPYRVVIKPKTLTMFPRIGNYNALCPWRCIKNFEPGSWINAHGLRNMGLFRWIETYYIHMIRCNYRILLSVQPESVEEAAIMGRLLKPLRLVGIEVNLCPNAAHDNDPNTLIDIIMALKEESKHPVGLKFGPFDPYLEYAQNFRGLLDWMAGPNAGLFSKMFPGQRSPLAKYGLIGAVSGEKLIEYGRKALAELVAATDIPIQSGGGIVSASEASLRLNMGAKGIDIGTAYLYPRRIPSIVDAIVRHPKANA